MKKRGFTLIELLAVIIILAIIALIATPIIMRVIENSKKAAAERSAENYVRAVETKAVAQMMKDATLEDGIYEIKQNGNICPGQSTDCSEENEIKIEMSGTKPSSGKIQVKNEKVIAYQLTIGGYENKYGTIPRIPLEYQEVEYIGSTGTQYIDTGIYLSSMDTVNCKFSITSFPDTSRAIYGARGDDEKFFTLLIRNPMVARAGASSYPATTTNVGLNQIYDTSLTAGKFIQDGATYNFTKVEFTLSRTAFVFARNQDSYNKPIPSRIYSFEIVGKFKGVPCYSTTTVTDVNGKECKEGTIGLYDLVSKEFYTNQGSGTFEKGNPV